ncbi:MAG: anti-sigma factor antagonist [Clostridia bacterium]|nr:anti-sigma factor antagonist [Clostridia bacterium]
MQLNLTADGTTLTAIFLGELDHHACPDARERIDMKLNGGIYNKLIFDFRGLTFMDSSAIALVMGRYKYMSVLNGKVYVVTGDAKMKKILVLAGLDRYVTILDN